MSEVKIDQPRKFWLQHGSHATVVVENENSNPTWGRKPFQVIETFALELLANQLQSENKLLRRTLEFYANKENWKTETKWVGHRGGFGDCDDMYPVDVCNMDEDKGKRAKKALKQLTQNGGEEKEAERG